MPWEAVNGMGSGARNPLALNSPVSDGFGNGMVTFPLPPAIIRTARVGDHCQIDLPLCRRSGASGRFLNQESNGASAIAPLLFLFLTLTPIHNWCDESVRRSLRRRQLDPIASRNLYRRLGRDVLS